MARWVQCHSSQYVTGARALTALRWVAPAHDHNHRLPPPTLARCPSEELVIHWENVVAGNVPAVERIFARAVSALTQGKLRWSELERTSNLSLTSDAITGKSEPKNQKSLTPWAAPKKGFSRVDLSTPCVRDLNSDWLPGPDFLLKGVSADGWKLMEQVANFRDTLDVMRRMHAEPPVSLSINEAKTDTLHRYRHVYDSAMRHLRFSCDDIEDAGHWKRVRPCVEQS